MNNKIEKKSIFPYVLILLLFVIFVQQKEYSQYISKKRFNSEFVTKDAKENYLNKINLKIGKNFTPPYSINEWKWKNLFYELSVDLIRTPKIKDAISFVLNKIDSVSENLSIRAILTARALYPNSLINEIDSLFHKTKKYKTALYSFHYLYFSDNKKYKDYLEKLTQRFGTENLLTKLTKKFISEKPRFFTEEELKVIFSQNFLKGELVIFTILRHNRKLPGITLIRKPNGKFIYKNDSLFSIRQLGYSVTNFPYYLIDGNTPQGLYSFEGFYQSNKKSIGPTPIPIIRLPFEGDAKNFFKNGSDTVMTLENYKSLFPNKIRGNQSINESFYAGKLGRKLLVMHGSTDNPLFYKTEPYFPLTPSTGCLTSFEKWDEKSGKLIESEQLKLVNTIIDTGRKKGFLFVFEIDDKKIPVVITEINKIVKINSLTKNVIQKTVFSIKKK